MSATDGFRRVFPPPRRKPGLLTILVRWRLEVLAAAFVAAVWWRLGAGVVLAVVAVVVVLVAAVPPVRAVAVRLARIVVIPHRVRSALIQAGVTDRAGRPPWLLGARVHGEAVVVWVWLRSGTTSADLRDSVGVIAAACGAVDVEISRDSARLDRATVIVHRPRWGVLGQ
jgi:hypothetical protein